VGGGGADWVVVVVRVVLYWRWPSVMHGHGHGAENAPACLSAVQLVRPSSVAFIAIHSLLPFVVAPPPSHPTTHQHPQPPSG